MVRIACITPRWYLTDFQVYSGLRYFAESARISRACHVWPQPRGTCRMSPGMDFLPIVWLNFSTKRRLLHNHVLLQGLGHQVLRTTLLGGQVADEPIGYFGPESSARAFGKRRSGME